MTAYVCHPLFSWVGSFASEDIPYLIFDLGRQLIALMPDGSLMILREYGDAWCVVQGYMT